MALVILRRILARFVARVIAFRRWRALIAALSIFVIGGAVYAAFSSFSPGSGNVGAASEMSVEGLEQNPSTGQILLVLKEKSGGRYLAMVVGQPEARAIHAELQGGRSERPEIYDLTNEMVQRLGGRISHVLVNNVSETTFYAKLILAAEGRQVEVDSRPSHAIALAMRARAPIYADSRVLEKAAISSPN